MFSYHPFSEGCTEALNKVVAYQLHTSHVYLTMAHSFEADRKILRFVSYFKALADKRRESANKFLKLLWTRNKKICPPTYEVDMEEITTPIKAILLAQEMERTFTSILLGLKDAARRESDLLSLLTKVLRKQRKNEDYMNRQLTYQQRIEREKEEEARTKNPETTSNEEEIDMEG